MKSKLKAPQKLKTFFKNQSDIDLVYQFGSSLSEDQHEESDLDIAVLFNEIPQAQRILQLVDQLNDIITSEVDLAVLNDASPIFLMQVVAKGKIIFCRDPKINSYFVIRTVNMYDDLSYYRRSQEKNILKGRLFG